MKDFFISSSDGIVKVVNESTTSMPILIRFDQCEKKQDNKHLNMYFGNMGNNNYDFDIDFFNARNNKEPSKGFSKIKTRLGLRW